MKDNFIVMLLTTEGTEYLRLDKEQLIELTNELQTTKEPVSLITIENHFFVVGYLVQGHNFNDYPRVISVGINNFDKGAVESDTQSKW